MNSIVCSGGNGGGENVFMNECCSPDQRGKTKLKLSLETECNFEYGDDQSMKKSFRRKHAMNFRYSQ